MRTPLEHCLRLRTLAHREGDHLPADDLHPSPLQDRAVLPLRGLRVLGQACSRGPPVRDPGVATPGPRRGA
eukprot:7816711-Alexandrium_andersonii.AAC.1